MGTKIKKTLSILKFTLIAFIAFLVICAITL